MPLETIILICASLTIALLAWGLVHLVMVAFPSTQSRVQARLAPRSESDPHAAEALYLLRKKPEALRARHSEWAARFEQRLQLVSPDMTLWRLMVMCCCAGLIVGVAIGYVAGMVLGL